MISAERKRNFAGFESLDHKLGVLRAGRGNFFQIFRVRRASLLLLGNRYGDVAAVFHLVAKSLKPRLKPCHAHGGGPHIHAAPRLSKVKGNADHANFLPDILVVEVIGLSD